MPVRRLLAPLLVIASIAASPVAQAQPPASAAELLRQAREHEAMNDDLVAVRRYTDALALDPTLGDAYLGLGALRMRRGDPREAERVFDVALSRIPALHRALVGRAEARWALGFRAEAEDDLDAYARAARHACRARSASAEEPDDSHRARAASATALMPSNVQ